MYRCVGVCEDMWAYVRVCGSMCGYMEVCGGMWGYVGVCMGMWGYTAYVSINATYGIKLQINPYRSNLFIKINL